MGVHVRAKPGWLRRRKARSNAIKSRTRSLNEEVIFPSQAFEEHLRLSERVQTGYATSPRPAARNSSASGSGRLFTYAVDEYGRAVALLRSEPFNATLSLWFTSADMTHGMYITRSYAFVGVDGVGIRYAREGCVGTVHLTAFARSAATPLFADLQPPRFGTGSEPRSTPVTGPVPVNRTVVAVVAVDLPNTKLTELLASLQLGNTNRSFSYYFSQDSCAAPTPPLCFTCLTGCVRRRGLCHRHVE